jgi:hypothetical protein
MHIARFAVPLVVVAGLLWTAAPVRSFDRGPRPSQNTAPSKQPPKLPPPANNPDAQDRISKKETRMKQRDKEIDKRMKQR